jgi:hypothetical protein
MNIPTDDIHIGTLMSASPNSGVKADIPVGPIRAGRPPISQPIAQTPRKTAELLPRFCHSARED